MTCTRATHLHEQHLDLFEKALAEGALLLVRGMSAL